MVVEYRRKNSFKASVTSEDSRRSREETTVQLRKTRKEEILHKRRMGGMKQGVLVDVKSNANKQDTSSPSNSDRVTEIVRLYYSWHHSPTSVPLEKLTDATREMRRMSTSRNAPYKEIVATGAIPFLVRFITMEEEDPDLVLEATWVITNLTSSTFTSKVVECGALEPLVKLIDTGNPFIRENAIWSLGNIASESTELRDFLLSNSFIVDKIISNMVEPANISMFQTVTWAVSNFLRGKPKPPSELVIPFLASLNMALKNCHTVGASPKDRSDAVWALSYITEYDVPQVFDLAIKCRIIETLFSFFDLYMNEKELMIPTVRAVGNFASGKDEVAEALIEKGFLKYAAPLIRHPSKNVRKDVCWIFSNLAAGTSAHREHLLNCNGGELIKDIIYVANTASFEVRKEALWTLSNLVTDGKDNIVITVVRMGGLSAFSRALFGDADVTLLLTVLEALKRIFEVSNIHQLDFDELFDESDGLEALELLQNHSSDTVYQAAVHLIDHFFNGEEEVDLAVVPESKEEGFSFGLPAKQLFPGGQPSPIKFDFTMPDAGTFPSAAV